MKIKFVVILSFLFNQTLLKAQNGGLNEDSLIKQGKLLFTEKKYSMAIVCYNQVIQLNSQNGEAYFIERMHIVV
jgi:hypothetical protein